MDALRVVIDDALRRLSPKSAMAKALAYGRKRWIALTRYLDDGLAEIDNNVAERAMRSVAIGRKNWLFAGSKAGGERAAAIYSVIETAKLISVLPVTEVKLHSLYIVKDTALAHMYEAGEVTLSSMEEYMERVILFLSYLRPDIVIQRIVGRASGGNTLAVNGGSPWWDVKKRIDALMEERGIMQGACCDYIDGKAVRRFVR